ncbi:MAG TPA: ribosome small subunit-dependent GTPase A [Vicinamibacterales bacterium]
MPVDRLTELGWNAVFAEAFATYADRCVPARVALEHQHIYRVYTADGDLLARIRGRLRHQAGGRDAFPAVGDWVALSPGDGVREAVIEAVLPRRSRFSRKVAGDLTQEQVLAANIDTVFLVSGLDHDFNLRRIERYLATALDGGARPVILLNKADLVPDPAAFVAQAETVASGAPVYAVSSRTGQGIECLRQFLGVGQTCAFLGSSGVGKSTLINALLGTPRQRTADVREKDSRGRHTTTHRELLMLPGGGLLIDTPGMRELQLWEGRLDDAFADIAALAPGCHFRDCRHEQEPRCAVRQAVDEGRLAADRLESFRRLQRELREQERRQDQLAMIEEKRRTRVIHRAMRRKR